MLNKKINKYTKEYKEYILKNIEGKVDKGMLELVNTINSIDDLITINCCQGELIESEEDEHCPRTYVDFYVLNHNYSLANDIFTDLISELGSMIKCSVEYEADFDFLDENVIEENGCVNLRYSIDFIEVNSYILITAREIYEQVIEIISKYKHKIR